MSNFRNYLESHEHSLRVLELLYLYDDFMDSIQTIADMGCGAGLDINWWATAMTRDEENPEPHNYLCYAVDKDLSKLDIDLPDNVVKLEQDFNSVKVEKKIDLIWSHDSFQYTNDPLGTLRHWNSLMNENAMLCMTVYQNIHKQHNRYVHAVKSNHLFNYTVPTLVYMLACSGFDCRDAYFFKNENDPWIHLAVYKDSNKYFDPSVTTWYDLADAGLLHDSALASINKYGYVKQDDLMYMWLDRAWYRVKD